MNIDIADIPATGLCAVEFAVEFDPSLVTISDVTTGALCNTCADAAEKTIDSTLADTVFTWNIQDDQICVLWVTGLSDSSYWLQDGGTFVTISGTVKSTAAAGSVADFDIVPIDRDANLTSGTKNTDIIAGYLDVSKKTQTYASSATSGYVKVLGDSDVLYGDADCNGKVDVSDLILLARFSAEDPELGPLSAAGKVNADCITDGVINASDVSGIARYLARLITAADFGPQAK